MNDYRIGTVLVPPLIIILLALGAMLIFETDMENQDSHPEPERSAIVELIEVSIGDTPKEFLNLEETISRFAQHSALATNRNRLVCSIDIESHY